MILASTLVLLNVLYTLGDHLVVDMTREYFTARIVVDGPQRPCSSFSSQITTFVDRVIYDDIVIWEAPTGRCSYINIYKLYKELCFAELKIEDGLKVYHLYLEYFDTIRVQRSEREFYLRLWKFFLYHTFDISYPVAPEKFTMKKYKPFGTPSRIFTPLVKYRILRVIDGDEMLWESPDGNDCASIIVHGERPSFVHLVIKGMEYYSFLYFAKGVDGIWTKVPKNDFYNKLELASGPAARF